MIHRLPFLTSLALAATGLLFSCDSGSASSPTKPDGGADGTLDTNTYGVPWNSRITYGMLADSRDGQSYRTVTIGSQTWMAQNLNYMGADASKVGVWYNNNADSGAKYGRLYTWAEALAGHASSTASPSGVQGVCPAGWHVPSDAEWSTLSANFIRGAYSGGTNLKSTRGWNTYYGSSGNGDDTYGFRALPASYRNAGGSFGSAGNDARFWSATKVDGNYPSHWSFDYSSAYMYRDNQYFDQSNSFSLRCLKD